MSPLKVMSVAAETCTAAGIWSQCLPGGLEQLAAGLKQLPNDGC